MEATCKCNEDHPSKCPKHKDILPYIPWMQMDSEIVEASPLINMGVWEGRADAD